ncbi:aldehyde dehydrogenase family protein [Amycolatopsis sp. GM8]|uniref:aldehyde dehydrogenase family protein n=1 Tax=Amycolatopsis sp. GM8 TaxID=2896530 RepID=UPI0027DFE53C|nr:aldehyde dehydrogenase family protein [Amycolatopsis sp. GM8]
MFGPVAVLSRFRTEEEAVSMANATQCVLAASVWTSDLAGSPRRSAASGSPVSAGPFPPRH